MSRKSSKQVNFSPNNNNYEDIPTFVFKQGRGGGIKVAKNRNTKVARISSFRQNKSSGFSPVKFLRRLGSKVARVFGCATTRKRSSRKVCSSSLARSRSYAEAIDSHQAEAIEDCIEFLNSSSTSLHRSSSVSASSSCFL